MGGFGGMGGGPRVVFRQGGGGGKGGFGGMGGHQNMFFDMGGGGMGGFPGMGSKGGGKGAPARRAPIPPHALPANTTVTLRGLKKVQEHNGKTGKITGWDAEKGRYEVTLERDETLSLRP